MTTAEDIERFEDELSLYEKEVDLNARWYKFFFINNIDMLKMVIDKLEEKYGDDETASKQTSLITGQVNPELNREMQLTLKDAKEWLHYWETRKPEATRTYQQNKRYLESLR